MIWFDSLLEANFELYCVKSSLYGNKKNVNYCDGHLMMVVYIDTVVGVVRSLGTFS